MKSVRISISEQPNPSARMHMRFKDLAQQVSTPGLAHRRSYVLRSPPNSYYQIPSRTRLPGSMVFASTIGVRPAFCLSQRSNCWCAQVEAPDHLEICNDFDYHDFAAVTCTASADQATSFQRPTGAVRSHLADVEHVNPPQHRDHDRPCNRRLHYQPQACHGNVAA